MSGDEQDGMQAVRMVAVMSLVDGRIDEDKIALVQEYASALDVHESYLPVLAEAAAGEVAAASVCMMRKNAETFPGLDLQGFDADRIAPFLPYRDGRADPGLAARYEALGKLGSDTFGHAFWDHFKRNRFAFPGDPNGLAEAFTTRHDTSHVLSGYSTSSAGELLVSTFIGAMHPDHPMAAEVLPALFSYHLGIAMNDIASVRSEAFEPQSFWTAWDRGAATSVDVFDPAWDFWTAIETPLEELPVAPTTCSRSIRHSWPEPAVDRNCQPDERTRDAVHQPAVHAPDFRPAGDPGDGMRASRRRRRRLGRAHLAALRSADRCRKSGAHRTPLAAGAARSEPRDHDLRRPARSRRGVAEPPELRQAMARRVPSRRTQRRPGDRRRACQSQHRLDRPLPTTPAVTRPTERSGDSQKGTVRW